MPPPNLRFVPDPLASPPSGDWPARALVTVTAPPDARQRSRDDEQSLPHGTTIGRYVVLAVLGRGGMSTVYRAEDPSLRRHVALKILRADLSLHLSARARFAHEGHAMGQLAHPHVAAVFDVGQHGDRVFLALELLEGGTLGAWMHPPRRWQEVHRVMSASARGLAAAHAAGIVHRDFKPENVLLTHDGVPRVSDFGLAGSLDAALPTTAGGDSSVTATGTVLGTPAYMAPEQRAGHVADERADQYSLCLVWLEALGRDRATPAPEPGDARGPRWLVRALLRGLDDQPARRWPSVEHLLTALTRARRRRRIGVGLTTGVVAAVVAVGLTLGRSATEPHPTAAAPTLIKARKPGEGPLRMRFAPDGRNRVISSSDRQALWLEDSLTGTREPLVLPPGLFSTRADAVAGVSLHGEVVLVRMQDRSVWRTGRGVAHPVLMRALGNGPVCLHSSGTKVAINANDHGLPIEIRSVDDGRVLATAPTGDLCTWAGGRLVLGWRPHTGEIPLQVIEPDGTRWDLPPLAGELSDLVSDGTDLWVAHTIGMGEAETGIITRVPLARPRSPAVIASSRVIKYGPLAVTAEGLHSARVSEIRSLVVVPLPQPDDPPGATRAATSLDTGVIRDGGAEWLSSDEIAYVRDGRLMRHHISDGRIDVITALDGRVLARVGDEVLAQAWSATGDACPVQAVSPAGARTLSPASCMRAPMVRCDRVGRCVLVEVDGEVYTFSRLDPRTGVRSAPVLTRPLTASPHVEPADDGRWLVEADGQLAVIDPDSGRETQLAPDFNADDASWGHDGTYVVAVGQRAGVHEVVRIDATGRVTTVLRATSRPYLTPRVSPDGRHLLLHALERPFEYVLFPR